MHGAQHAQHDPAYPDDPYAYQDGYATSRRAGQKRRGGMMTVAVVLALAVVGTGAAFAYRTYVGSPRSGEPPVIKADTSPTKVVPAPADGAAKLPDRMAPGDGTEKLVSREEAPVDVNARAGPRVVFPPLNQNANPPSTASVAPASASRRHGAATARCRTDEPRQIKTLTVRGDQADAGNATPRAAARRAANGCRAAAQPAAAPAPRRATAHRPMPAPMRRCRCRRRPPRPPAAPRPRVAATTPCRPRRPAGGGYLVQVSSQTNEADAQASYRALQGKFPAVLGSRAPVIKRADLGEKGVYYRAMVGPFGSPDEASQFCGSLKSAGGQCVVQRN